MGLHAGLLPTAESTPKYSKALLLRSITLWLSRIPCMKVSPWPAWRCYTSVSATYRGRGRISKGKVIKVLIKVLRNTTINTSMIMLTEWEILHVTFLYSTALYNVTDCSPYYLNLNLNHTSVIVFKYDAFWWTVCIGLTTVGLCRMSCLQKRLPKIKITKKKKGVGYRN